MQNKSFSIRESFNYAWNTFKQHRSLFLKIIITLFLLQVVNALVSEGLKNVLPLLYAIISVFLAVVGIILSIGIYDVFLKIYKGEEVSYAQIFARKDLFLRYLIGAILYGLIIFAILALIFLILISFFFVMDHSNIISVSIPTFIMGAMSFVGISVIVFIWSLLFFCFWGWSLVDHNLGARASLKRSAQITKGNRLSLLSFIILICFFNILGFIALVVGLVVTIPMSYAAMSFVYKKLDEKIPLPNNSENTEDVSIPQPVVPSDSGE